MFSIQSQFTFIVVFCFSFGSQVSEVTSMLDSKQKELNELHQNLTSLLQTKSSLEQELSDMV